MALPGQSTVITKIDASPQLIAALKALGKASVLVGIPAENQPRPGEKASNALIGYIQETGSPANNIPARPFLVPGVTNSQAQWGQRLFMAGEAAMAGDQNRMRQRLGEAGQIAVNEVRRTIQRGIPPPLSPATVARRQRRTPGSSYRRAAMTPGDVTPLIDTGDLIHAVVWVLGS
jgi:hypothetical protein